MPNNYLEWKKTREKGPQFAVVTARIYAYYIVPPELESSPQLWLTFT